jgi:ribonuclease Z
MTLRVTFLGTSGAVPTVERNPPALFVNREGDQLLFDCGEGTQRQMMRFGTGFGVSHLFVTHLHGDHVLGIPGLVQTWDFNDRTEPLAIHAPHGTRSTVEDLVATPDGQPSFPVRIHQVGPGDVALDGEEYAVQAFEVDHRTTAVGYALVEDDRKGRFDRQKAEHELGIDPGPAYSKLHDGESVELEDGRVIEPDQVVGPPRPGRRLVYTGDTLPVDATVEAADDADLLIHDATFTGERADRARKTAHSTAREAAAIAARADASRLALTHVSSRYAGDASGHEREARAELEERGATCEAFVPEDGYTMEVPFPELEE